MEAPAAPPGASVVPPIDRNRMEDKKVAIRLNNEDYFRAHPELRALVRGFVSAVVVDKPNDVHAYAARWFTAPGMAESLGLGAMARRPEMQPSAEDPSAAARLRREAAAAGPAASGASGEATVDLERKLAALFKEADRDGNGVLDHAEFKAVMKTSSLGLRPAEIKRLLQEVDEDADGNVSYAEFVPIALDVIQALRTKDKVRAADKQLAHQVEEAANQMVNGMPKQAMLDLARRAFDHYDADGSGRLSRGELRSVLRDARLGLNAKQVRLVLANLDTSGDGELSFDEFAPFMAEVLVEQYKHELRTATFGDLEAQVRDMFQAADAEGHGRLYRARVVEVLLGQDLVLLSRMQATAIAAQAAQEEDGTIDVAAFVPTCAAMLRALTSPEAVAERATMLSRADFQPVELMGGRQREAMEANFADAFAKYDIDNNHYLDEHEFELCLNSAALGLERHEIYALMGMVDANTDGMVDASEFVTCAYDHLLHIKREKKILEAQSAAA